MKTLIDEWGRVSAHQLDLETNPLPDCDDAPGDLTDEQLDALTRGDAKTALVVRLTC